MPSMPDMAIQDFARAARVYAGEVRYTIKSAVGERTHLLLDDQQMPDDFRGFVLVRDGHGSVTLYYLVNREVHKSLLTASEVYVRPVRDRDEWNWENVRPSDREKPDQSVIAYVIVPTA
jgi:hypothetical protein